MKVRARELMPIVSEALERGAHVRFTATGSSMRPFIRDGDTVEIESLHRLPVRVGDILLVQGPEGQYVIHRVRSVKQGWIYLLGDAHQQREGPYAREQLIGRVRSVQHNGKTLYLDRGWRRLAGVLWMALVPLRPWIFRWGSRLKQLIRRCRPRKPECAGAPDRPRPTAHKEL